MKKNLDALTGLRFVAAFLVVLLHFGNPKASGWIHNILSHGFVAVTLFFVLSGFILTYSYMDSEGRLTSSKRTFWLARVARIYPVHLLGFVIYSPFAYQEVVGAASAWP